MFFAGLMCAVVLTAGAIENVELRDCGLEIVGGGIPGAILVAGKPAFPLVEGRVGKVSVPVAAASTSGAGRIVAVSHECFLSREGVAKPSNKAFLRSSLRWLSGDVEPKTVCYSARDRRHYENAAKEGGCDLQVLDRLDQLDSLELPAVLLLNPESHGVREMAKVERFMKRGGGVLCTVVGWGWRQITGGSFQTQSAFNALAGPAGLFTNGDMVRPLEGSGFPPVGSERRVMSLEEALSVLNGKADIGEGDARQASLLLSAFGQILPKDDSRYRPALAKAAGDYRNAAVPSPKSPLTIRQVRDRLALSLFQDSWLMNPERVYPAHPAASVYPGIPESKMRETRTVTMDLSVPRWHGTGLFAVAGEPLKVTIDESLVREGLRLRIGTTTCRVTAHDKWMRAPVVDVEVPLCKTETTLSSPFGGMIYVVVPNGKSGSAKVKISSACPAPWFALGRTSVEEWRRSIRSLPAPFAEIESASIALTVPSSLIRDLDDPTPLLKVWAEILDIDAKFTALPMPRRSAERMCVDVQLCAGFMHAGYPIMIPWVSARHLVNAATIRAGKEENVWGLFHEMGHNHQNPDWNFSGAGEVTVNFFTLRCMEEICGIKPRQTRMGREGIRRAYERWEAAGHPYDKWKSDPFLALEFFVRLYERFGWEPFEKMFAECRTLPPSERPKNDYEKRKLWAQRFSRIVGEDLCPLFNYLRNPGEPEFKLEAD